jgi:RNA polymerase sigma-70 factor (ECF subfamily)
MWCLSRDLTEDAAWLASLLVGLYPQEPEPAGLLALMWLHLARTEARFDDGKLVLLEDQDRSRWNRTLIARAVSLLERAIRVQRPGPYQIQAAIAAGHAEASSFADTDWAQILTLYDLLIAIQASPIVRLHRAVVLARVHGAGPALVEVDSIADSLSGYHLLHAVRGHLLHELGNQEQAHAAQLRAAELTVNPAEQALLRRRIQDIQGGR